MNWIDILILVVIAASILVGIWKGFIYETLSLLSWVASFVVARIYAPEMAQWLQQSIESESVILLLSWLLPFLVTLLALNLVKILLIKIITIAGLRPIDRLLGAFFGAIKGALLVTAGVIVIQLILSRSGEAFDTDSKLVPHFQVIALWMLESLNQETELSFDNVVGRIGTIIDDNLEGNLDGNLDGNIEAPNLEELQDKLGLTNEQLQEILDDDLKLEKLKQLLEEQTED